MSKLDFVRMTATLKLEEMRAYIMSAFSPEQISPMVDAALERARIDFPAHVKQEAERALQEAVSDAIKDAVSPWRLREAINKQLRPVVLRALATAYGEAADIAERGAADEGD